MAWSFSFTTWPFSSRWAPARQTSSAPASTSAGPRGEVLKLMPALNIPHDVLAEGLGRLSRAIDDVLPVAAEPLVYNPVAAAFDEGLVGPLLVSSLDRTDLEQLGFTVAGYGCTTCIGNAGDLAPEINEAITKSDLVCAAVLSGNRNFEARIHPNLKANFLASPPLVVAYAIAGDAARARGLLGERVLGRDFTFDIGRCRAFTQ
mgnify:CR=1 FL=1